MRKQDLKPELKPDLYQEPDTLGSNGSVSLQTVEAKGQYNPILTAGRSRANEQACNQQSGSRDLREPCKQESLQPAHPETRGPDTGAEARN